MVGKHYIIDFKMTEENIEQTSWKKILLDATSVGNVTVLNVVDKFFEPMGYTCLVLLSESHISVHTFPEKNLVCMDIFTCNMYKESNIEEMVNYIKKNINYMEYNLYFLERG